MNPELKQSYLSFIKTVEERMESLHATDKNTFCIEKKNLSMSPDKIDDFISGLRRKGILREPSETLLEHKDESTAEKAMRKQAEESGNTSYIRIKINKGKYIPWKESLREEEPKKEVPLPLDSNENILIMADLSLNRKTGVFTRSEKLPTYGRLIGKQLQLILKIEKWIKERNSNPSYEDVAKELRHGKRKVTKGAFSTLLSKTRKTIGDQEKKIICDETDHARDIKTLFLPTK